MSGYQATTANKASSNHKHRQATTSKRSSNQTNQANVKPTTKAPSCQPQKPTSNRKKHEHTTKKPSNQATTKTALVLQKQTRQQYNSNAKANRYIK